MFDSTITDVFFDLDHTLWDFEKNSALTFDKIFRENDISVRLDVFLQRYQPINLEYWKLYREEKVDKVSLRYGRLKKTFDALDIPISDGVIATLSEQYIAHLSSFNHVFPHTEEVLLYLHPKYKLHIITNGFQEIQDKKLKNANIDHYFEHVVNSEMAGVKKPNAKIFELALHKANVHPRNALMVGDNLEADILGAKTLGFQVLHFNSNREPVHEICPIIDSLLEIKSIL